MESYYDLGTYIADGRRTQVPLHKTIFRVDHEKDAVTVTNEVPGLGQAPQLKYLWQGNGAGRICAQGYTRHVLKGYNSADGHKTIARGGKKTEPGDLGVVRPRVLKFWDKHNGTWAYRRCVRTIDSNIVNNFRDAVDTAIRHGLEDAARDAELELEQMTVAEDWAALVDKETHEEFVYEEASSMHDEEERREIENEQRTVASKEGQKVEGWLTKLGVRASGIKNTILTKLGGLWQRKT